MTTLSGKVALITGGSRRIGACIARTLHESGMRIIIHYRDSSTEAEALQEALCEVRNNSVLLIQGDLSEIGKVKNLVRKSISEFGQLDCLINNASRFFPTPLHSTTEEEWQALMDTNLKAPYFLSQAAAPYLARDNGHIINIADIYADRPLASHPVYCASKAGLISLTRSLAIELAPDVRVNAISPGAIMWPENAVDEISQKRIVSKTPLKTTGHPQDIANAIQFLLSEGTFINGQTINVDGGRTIVA